MKELPLTPLMTISLTLTIGIIIAKWGYDDLPMRDDSFMHPESWGFSYL